MIGGMIGLMVKFAQNHGISVSEQEREPRNWDVFFGAPMAIFTRFEVVIIYIYTYTYTYTYIYTYIYIYILHMYMCIYIYTYIYMYTIGIQPAILWSSEIFHGIYHPTKRLLSKGDLCWIE